MSLKDQIVINNFAESIDDAITTVGGDTSNVQCLNDYSDIIKKQLISTDISGGFPDAPSDDKIYGRKNREWVQVNDSSSTTAPLSPPHPKSEDIPTGTPFQKVFEKLFDEILPAMPSIIKGDVIISSDEGTDQFQHPNYQTVKIKSGLDPNNYYIRIFIASQEEPIYISVELLKSTTGEGKIYNGSSGDDIDINVNNDTNIISATLKQIPYELISGHVDNAFDVFISDNKISTTDATNIFNEIFN